MMLRQSFDIPVARGGGGVGVWAVEGKDEGGGGEELVSMLND